VGDDQLETARSALDAATETTTGAENETLARLGRLTATLETAIEVQAAIVDAYEHLSFGIDRLETNVSTGQEWVDRAVSTRDEASDAFETLGREYTELDARALPVLRTDTYQRKHNQLVSEYRAFENFGRWVEDLRRGIDSIEEAERHLENDEYDRVEWDAERAANTFQRILDGISFRGIPDSLDEEGDTLRSVVEEYQQEARDLKDRASQLST